LRIPRCSSRNLYQPILSKVAVYIYNSSLLRVRGVIQIPIILGGDQIGLNEGFL